MSLNTIVSIICCTYNHDKYIRQSLEGFVKQKTSFNFEVLIHDDASTDNTAQIIKEFENKYPNIIKPIYQKENQYSKGVDILQTYLYPQAKGKYIALCEGDDYWTDPLKLQKQVDLLENNNNYGMCYTKIQTYDQAQNKFGNVWGGDFTSFNDLLIENRIPTLTSLINKELLLKYTKDINPSNKNWKMGDYPMWLWFAAESNIAYIPEVTGIYRILSSSASHSCNPAKNIEFIINTYDIRLFFSQKYNNEQYPYLEMEKKWWLFILAILNNDKKSVDLYHQELIKQKTTSLKLKKKILLILSKVNLRLTRSITEKYINLSYGKF